MPSMRTSANFPQSTWCSLIREGKKQTWMASSFLRVSKRWERVRGAEIAIIFYLPPRPRRRTIRGRSLPWEGMRVVSFQSPDNFLSIKNRESIPLNLQSILPLDPFRGLSSLKIPVTRTSHSWTSTLSFERITSIFVKSQYPNFKSQRKFTWRVRHPCLPQAGSNDENWFINRSVWISTVVILVIRWWLMLHILPYHTEDLGSIGFRITSCWMRSKMPLMKLPESFRSKSFPEINGFVDVTLGGISSQ